MNGITLVRTNARFIGRNVIQNNKHTEGAGIILKQYAYIEVDGELILVNNTVLLQGGAIFMTQPISISLTLTIMFGRHAHLALLRILVL